MKSRRVCIRTRPSPASLPLKGQATRHNCKMAYSLFKVGNKPIFYKEWLANAVVKVKDLLKEQNSFLSVEECRRKFKFIVCSLSYCGVISLLKTAKRSVVNNSTEKKCTNRLACLSAKRKKQVNLHARY